MQQFLSDFLTIYNVLVFVYGAYAPGAILNFRRMDDAISSGTDIN
jgi:hypothetical protein